MRRYSIRLSDRLHCKEDGEAASSTLSGSALADGLQHR